MNRTMDMTVGKPSKLILKFAFPLILANMGQQLYMIVDGIIVGRGVGVNGLAAVGASDWIYWLILWSMIMLTQGFSTFVARYFGEKNYESLNKTIATSAVLSAFIAILLTAAGILAARPLLMLLKTPSEILDSSHVYLVTMISGTVIVGAYNLASAILRAFGDGRSPFVAMLISAVLNVVLDLLFVMVFGWGIFGAAFASVMSQLVSFIYCLFRIKRIECVRLEKRYFKPDWALIGKLLSFSLPLALQYAVISVGGIVLQSTVNLWGNNFIAGYTATNKLYGLLESTAIALGSSFSTYFSQNYGAKDHSRMRLGVRTSIRISIVTSLIVTSVILLIGKYLPGLFLDMSEEGSAEALSVAVKYLNVMACCLIILYLIYVFRNVLQAMGNSLWSMISGFAECAARIVMAKVVVNYMGVDTLFAVEPVAWLWALLLVMIPYFFYSKRLKEDKIDRKELL